MGYVSLSTLTLPRLFFLYIVLCHYSGWSRSLTRLVPLKVGLDSQTDIPIVQVSLPGDGSPGSTASLGRALRSLRAQGYAIIGTGQIVHNLRDVCMCLFPASIIRDHPTYIPGRPRLENADVSSRWPANRLRRPISIRRPPSPFFCHATPINHSPISPPSIQASPPDA